MAVRQPVGRLPATGLDSCSTIALDAVVDGPALLPPPVLLMLSLSLVLVLVLVRVLVLVLVFVLVILLLVLLLPKRLLKLSNAAPTQSPDEDELFVASTIRLTSLRQACLPKSETRARCTFWFRPISRVG
jgi:hypothetical protein